MSDKVNAAIYEYKLILLWSEVKSEMTKIVSPQYRLGATKVSTECVQCKNHNRM